MEKRGFCRFSHNIYWGDSVKKHTLMKWRLYRGKGPFDLYVITRAQFDRDQLDIVNCAFLRQPYFKLNPPMIYGIAGSYDEALDLVVRISDEAASEGMQGELLRFLMSKPE